MDKCHECGKIAVKLYPALLKLTGILTRKVVVGICGECKQNQKVDQNENRNNLETLVVELKGDK